MRILLSIAVLQDHICSGLWTVCVFGTESKFVPGNAMVCLELELMETLQDDEEEPDK